MNEVIMYFYLTLCALVLVIVYVGYNISRLIKEEKQVLRELESTQFNRPQNPPYNWATEAQPSWTRLESITPPYEATGEARAISNENLEIPTYIRRGRRLNIKNGTN